MTKCFCDRCGEEGAAYVVFSGAFASSLQITRLGPALKAELCQRCADRAALRVQAAYTEAMMKD